MPFDLILWYSYFTGEVCFSDYLLLERFNDCLDLLLFLNS